MNKSKILFFLFLAFIEGASVMATELIGAKLLAPYFGSSLYVWSSVMAVTLGGLALGYFIGGRLSVQSNKENKLYTVLVLASIYLFAMPYLAKLSLLIGSNFSLIVSVIFGASILLLPALFFMGMVSPLLISILSNKPENAGKRSGEVYAISTLGGILSTFLTGFVLIPNWGLSTPLYAFACVLIILPLMKLIKNHKYFNSSVFIFMSLGAFYLSFISSKTNANTIYSSNGLLGQLEVIEYKQRDTIFRLLTINGIVQAGINLNTNKSNLDYMKVIENNLKTQAQPAQALLLGLGGGTLVNTLKSKNYEVTAIELDSRIVDVAKKYFQMPQNANVCIDDARRGLQSIKHKSDFILMDLFTGEVPPSHVFTKESLMLISNLLNDSGILVINTYGYTKPNGGEGNFALTKTLQAVGLNCKWIHLGDKVREDYSSNLLYCSKHKLLSLPNEIETPKWVAESKIITDDKPCLEYLNSIAAKRWRFNYLRNFILNR